ncbi:glycine-rich domain-containing 2-like [Brachionus plicatilis]|uniref:Glycine-rich domain-containing 2-like n=1 Tax=Brachionus plicatilis TaxID=10195 RepID=A0A3M7PJM6_BRAPC|nr:glycine-rich domain-containing 2-like [Brachionus plicatilis]
MDVAWIWHCHMLSPIHYREETFGTIFPHSCQSLNDMHFKQVQTVSLWENETGLSFDNNKPNSVDASYENFKSEFSCDLFESSKRQKNFNYQVSLPHFHSENFLTTALESYRKLLYLNKLYPKRFFVPCYAIAIIWHSHQLFPIEYNQDCCEMFGRIFPHDNSVNDRLYDSKPGTCIWITNFKLFTSSWKRTFREEFIFSGGMYRGSEPNEIKYTASDDLNLQDYCDKLRSANFRIDELTLNNEKRILLISLFRTTNELIISNEILTNKFKTNREIVFDESETRLILKIRLKEKFIEQFINVIDTGYLKYSIFDVKSEKNIIKFDFVKNNFELVDKFYIIDECKSFDLKDRFEDDDNEKNVKEVKFSVIPDRENLLIAMVENCKKNLENKPGLRACHSVTVRNEGIKVYDAEILHIPGLKWSSIRILYNGGCVASAHLIDSSQLPSPYQVEPSFCSFNPKRERALLARGEYGDFAIIKASWEGKKLNSSFEEGSIGYLYITIVELDTCVCHSGGGGCDSGGGGCDSGGVCGC